MVTLKELIRIDKYEWEIPKKHHKDMRVPVRIFASQRIIEDTLHDRSFDQAINVAMLPGLVGSVAVMPDVHQGYGFPIGGVAASDAEEGIISPGAIGYDINCGVRLMSSHISFEEAKPFLTQLNISLFQSCPSGVGKSGVLQLNRRQLEKICHSGSRWALENGYVTQNDLDCTEDGGCIEGADPSFVSARAMERGLGQVGSLGAGNHFIEISVVDEVVDMKAAQTFNLEEGKICLMVHSGSRGFGHQICTDYVRDFQRVSQKYQIKLPDRELVSAPLSSPEGKAYLSAMRCAANYAFCNRQLLADTVRKVFEQKFTGKVSNPHLQLVYDLAHNMGKIETHSIAGKEMQVCVHRKGATRAFAANHPDVPKKYQSVGQPVLVPGSMGTASWVLVGTPTGMEKSFGSCCHGAGRVFSRKQARREVRGEELIQRLDKRGIHVMAGSKRSLPEEAPEAYKDVDEVVASVVGAGLARRVARLRPLAVIKG